jgi:NAD(P)-dependent dehydrogenase (short-subunit alcohol dehydrogenase family)
MPSLNGAVVLVTGANSGLGTHFVHDALTRGAVKVYATARIRAWDDERIVPLTLDVTDPASIEAAVAAAPDVTVLVNNAGATPPSASLLDVTETDIRAKMKTNFFGRPFPRPCFHAIWKVAMTPVVTWKKSTGEIIGTVTLRNTLQWPAPSTRAASSSSVGTPCKAVSMMIIPPPRSHYVMMMRA